MQAVCALQEKGPGAPSGDKPLKSGETPKPNKRSFHTSAASCADDKRAADTDSPVGNAKGMVWCSQEKQQRQCRMCDIA